MTDYLGMMRGKKQKCTPKGKRKLKQKMKEEIQTKIWNLLHVSKFYPGPILARKLVDRVRLQILVLITRKRIISLPSHTFFSIKYVFSKYKD